MKDIPIELFKVGIEDWIAFDKFIDPNTDLPEEEWFIPSNSILENYSLVTACEKYFNFYGESRKGVEFSTDGLPYIQELKKIKIHTVGFQEDSFFVKRDDYYMYDTPQKTPREKRLFTLGELYRSWVKMGRPKK